MEVKRIPPCPDYDIRGTEKWLEDMAAQGYILCRGYAFQYGFAYFETGDPRPIRYRMEPAKKVSGFGLNGTAYSDEPDADARKSYEEFGWHYITSRSQFWIFACEDDAAPELNTDPQIQAISLKLATKRLWDHFLWLILYGVLLGLPRSGSFFCGTLVQRGLGFYWPKLVFLALVCAAWLPGLVHLTRFRNTLKQGIWPEPTAKASSWKVYALLLLRIGAVVWIFAAALLVPSFYSRTGIPMTAPEAKTDSLVTVSDLFPEAEVEYISPNPNGVLYQWSTDSAPDCRELYEHFRLTLPDGSTTTGVWELNRYETAFDWIAEGCAMETRFTHWIRRGTTLLETELENADWFRAYHVEAGKIHSYACDVLLIQKDNVVIQCTLYLYDELPDAPGLAQIAETLLANES